MVVQSIASMLTAWSDDWMAGGYSLVGAEVMTLADCAHPEIRWLSCLLKDVPGIAIGCNAGWQSQLQTLLIGSSVDAPRTTRADAVLQELSHAALSDLAARILQTTGLSQKQGVDLTRGMSSDIPDLPGCAYIAVQARFPHAATMILLLAPDIIDAVSGLRAALAKTPVVPVLRALDDERVVLEAIVGEGELTLDELRTLSAGDVIPLRRNVNQEIVLQLDSDTAVCGGFLGNAHGRFAVQLKSR